MREASRAAATVPGIHDVIAEIRSVIDPGNHQIRKLDKQVPERVDDAIGRSAIENIMIRTLRL